MKTVSIPGQNQQLGPCRGLSLVLLLAGASGAFAGDCGDPFAGTSWSSAFDVIDKVPSKNSTAAVAGGKLTLMAAGRDIYNTTNEYVALRRKGVEGDFDMSVAIESQENVHEWSQAGFVVANDLDNLAQGGYVALDVTPKNGRVFFSDTKGTPGTLDSNFAKGVSGYPVWIRLAKKNKLFSAWYKEKAADAWTVLVSDKSALQTAAVSHIALFSLSHDASKQGKTVFTSFTCADASAATSILPPVRGSRFERRSFASRSDFGVVRRMDVLNQAWVTGRRSGGR